MQGYYFETQKLEKNCMTFAYIWREEDDATTAPPVKEFHSNAQNADEKVSTAAAKWIREHGCFCDRPIPSTQWLEQKASWNK